MSYEPEPECEVANVNGTPFHNMNRDFNTGECLFCMALRSAYTRGYKDGEQE